MNAMTNLKEKLIPLGTMAVVLLILIYPYLVLQGRLDIGGDDSRLYYSMGKEYLKNMVFSSWYHFSGQGTNNSQIFLLPITLVVAFFQILNVPPNIIQSTLMSLNIILGFIFFQLSMKKILSLEKINTATFISAIFYISSPILITGMLNNPLYSVWLISIIPLTYYFLHRYIETDDFAWVAGYCAISVFYSLAFVTSPWLVGFLLIIALGGPLFVVLFKPTKEFWTKLIIFTICTMLIHTFWLLPLLTSFFASTSSFISRGISEETAATFVPTVDAVSQGSTIIYPILNLFHRQIQFNYTWQLRVLFTEWYDYIILINLAFIITVLIAFLLTKTKDNDHKLGTLLFAYFIIALFFFTVNIGIFKELFYLFEYIPGGAMFRNFQGKFALSFILFYATLLAYSIQKINKHTSKNFFRFITFVVLIMIVITAVPLFKGTIFTMPLWTTTNIGTDITRFPPEYLDFMNNLSDGVPHSSFILSYPYGLAGYTIIKEEESNNSYVGTSPVILFTGVNDFSGHLSFQTKQSNIFIAAIREQDKEKVQKFMYLRNINYIFITKNIPEQILNSYLFSLHDKVLQSKKQILLQLNATKLLESVNENYQLLELQNKNTMVGTSTRCVMESNMSRMIEQDWGTLRTTIFTDNACKSINITPPKISFERKEPYKYVANVSNITSDFYIFFLDDYDTGWVLLADNKKISLGNHMMINGYANGWKINKSDLCKDKTSCDASVELYFEPQNYIVSGLVISSGLFIIFVMYLILRNIHIKLRRHS